MFWLFLHKYLNRLKYKMLLHTTDFFYTAKNIFKADKNYINVGVVLKTKIFIGRYLKMADYIFLILDFI